MRFATDAKMQATGGKTNRFLVQHRLVFSPSGVRRNTKFLSPTMKRSFLDRRVSQLR